MPYLQKSEILDTLTIKQEAEADSQRKKPKSLVRLLVVFFLAIIGGAAIGWIVGTFLLPRGSSHMSESGIIVFIILAILAIYLVLLVHEVGHLICGLLVGFRFMLLIVGPLKIAREQGNIRIGWNTHTSLYGGITACIPRDEEGLPEKMRIMVVGGPLASLLLALLGIGLAILIGFSGQHSLPPLFYFLLLTGIISGGIFLVTSFPARAGGFLSDGARFLMLSRGGAEAERWSAISSLLLSLIGGELPREWSPTLLQKAVALADNSPDDVVANSFGYYYALDKEDIIAARDYLAHMLKGFYIMPAISRPGFALEAAYFEACYQRNADAARIWFTQVKGGMIDVCTRRRVEAAVLCAEGKRDEALVVAREGLAAVKNANYIGTGRMEEAWLKKLVVDIEASS